MKGKNSALLWSIIHSIGDTLEEKVLLKYNEKYYLFWVNLISGLFIFIVSLFSNVELTWISSFVLIAYSLAIIGGDFCYAKAIQTLPLGLANLIDSGSLFIILICDIILGFIEPKVSFIIIFIIFFISIYVFSYETNKIKGEITNKKIDLKNIFILITSTIFYASEPYFLKLAISKGANEIGVNLVYYIIAIPVFFLIYQKSKKNIKEVDSKNKKSFFKNVIALGIIYAITSLLNSLAFASGSPTMITLIMKLQLFIVVIFSVIRKTDKMNAKKTISLIVGVICIVIMSLIS